MLITHFHQSKIENKPLAGYRDNQVDEIGSTADSLCALFRTKNRSLFVHKQITITNRHFKKSSLP